MEGLLPKVVVLLTGKIKWDNYPRIYENEKLWWLLADEGVLYLKNIFLVMSFVHCFFL